MKILVVEDEIKIAQAMRRALELKGHTVDTAADGEAGLDLAIGETYDLIILDLMLPKQNGIEVCRQVREEEIHTPIIMLTAKGQIRDKVTGLDAGADDYLVKPFSFEELFARIRALTRRPPKTTTHLLSVSNLTIDLESRIVVRSKKKISLSTREFALLEYLVRNKGKVQSKEQIIRSVWNYDADVLESTIEVHIKHVRDKVDKPFPSQKPLIKTIHGFGYIVEE